MLKLRKVIVLICIIIFACITSCHSQESEKKEWKSHILIIPVSTNQAKEIAKKENMTIMNTVVNLAEFLYDNKEKVNDIKEGTIYNDGIIRIAGTSEEFVLEIKAGDFYLHYTGGLGMPVMVGPAKIEHIAKHNWLIFGATYVGDYTCLYIDGYQNK